MHFPLPHNTIITSTTTNNNNTFTIIERYNNYILQQKQNETNASTPPFIVDLLEQLWTDISLHLFLMGLSTIIFILLILLYYNNKNNIALRFRKILPFSGMIVIFLDCIFIIVRDGNIIHMINNKMLINNLNIIDLILKMIINTLYGTLIFKYFIQIWQYYHLERFQYLMKRYNDKDDKFSIKRYVKMTSTTNRYFPVIFILILQILIYIILLILGSLNKINYHNLFIIFSSINGGVIGLSIFITLFLILFIEIILKKLFNFNDIKNDLFYKYDGYFNGDIYLLRLEFISYFFMSFLFILALGYDIVNIIDQTNYSNKVIKNTILYFLILQINNLHLVELAAIILYFMVKLLILLTFGALIVLLTIRHYISCCNNGHSSYHISKYNLSINNEEAIDFEFTELTEIINDLNLSPLFESYCMKEFKLQYFYLFKQLIDLSTFEGPHSIYERAQHIRKLYKRFLKKFSPFPCNLSRNTLRLFHLKKEDSITPQEIKELVLLLKVETLQVLSDVLVRFKGTETFKKNEKKLVQSVDD